MAGLTNDDAVELANAIIAILKKHSGDIAWSTGKAEAQHWDYLIFINATIVVNGEKYVFPVNVDVNQRMGDQNPGRFLSRNIFEVCIEIMNYVQRTIQELFFPSELWLELYDLKEKYAREVYLIT